MTTPIDMVLHCPACQVQHIDAPAPLAPGQHYGFNCAGEVRPWANPPHRSHLCAVCGHVWRPADVPTNGVAAVKTKGKDDSSIRTIDVGYVQRLQDEVRALGERIHAQREEINRLHYLGD